jgi:hypothetical protein
MLAGTGFFLSAKVPSPWHSGVFFLSSIALNSLPSYYEGILDIKNSEKDAISSPFLRKVGFYMLMAGYGIIIIKHRRM